MVNSSPGHLPKVVIFGHIWGVFGGQEYPDFEITSSQAFWSRRSRALRVQYVQGALRAFCGIYLGDLCRVARAVVRSLVVLHDYYAVGVPGS